MGELIEKVVLQNVEAKPEDVKELFKRIAHVLENRGDGHSWPNEVVISAAAAIIGIAVGSGHFDIEGAIEVVTRNVRDVATEAEARAKADHEKVMAIVKEKTDAYLKQCEADKRDPDPKEIEKLLNEALPGNVKVQAVAKVPTNKGSYMVPGVVGHA